MRGAGHDALQVRDHHLALARLVREVAQGLHCLAERMLLVHVAVVRIELRERPREVPAAETRITTNQQILRASGLASKKEITQCNGYYKSSTR